MDYMEACRACLATEEDMVPLNEDFVNAYNLLTNLNVVLSDPMPQYACQSCCQSVKYYLEFRERCVTTETSLQEVILQKVKLEADKDDLPLSELKNTDIKIKLEVKDEENIKFNCDETCFEEDNNYFDYSEPVKNEKREDTKSKKRKYKKRKHKNDKKVKLEIPSDKLETNLSCGLCKNIFKERSELSAHIETHSKDLNCGLCSAQFKNWPALVGHRFTHIPTKETRCHICNKFFWGVLVSAPVNMEYHYMKEHYDGEKVPLVCKFCFRSYETPRKLSKHIISAHSKKLFICDYCNKTYNNKSMLRSHIKRHSDDRPFICELCGFSSKHSGGLLDHKIRKHAPDKVKCKQCERWFATPAARGKHACSAQTKICPVCGLPIKTRNFNRHLRQHSSVMPYKCARCSAAYKTKSALTVHINRHDGIRPVQCPHCPQKFYSHSVLTKHKRIHTGEKPYVCKICHKGFTGNNNLKVHMRVHGEYLVVKRNKPEVSIAILGTKNDDELEWKL